MSASSLGARYFEVFMARVRVKSLLFKSLFLILLGSCIAQETSSCSTILEYVHEHLPCSGTLKSANGFVYVDLDDAYIHELIQFIRGEGFEEPPYFDRQNLVGAHITVIYPEEMKKYQIADIEESGMSICFTPRTCQAAHPPRWKEVNQVYFIVVDAPQLDDLREKYGLPKRKYDFHITIGIKTG